MKIESEYIIRTKEFNEILKKYDFVMIAIDGVFGFYPDETSNYFCKVGSFYYSLDTFNMKVRVFNLNMTKLLGVQINQLFVKM